MKGNAPLSPITGVPGWETEDEQKLLQRLAAQVPNKGLIVEIGGEFGQSASIFANAADKSVKIMTVDLFPGTLLDDHRANLAEAGYEDRTEQLQMDSKTLKDTKWASGPIDLLFIDGDHTYQGVRADIESWIPHVKVGGVVVFHDCASVENKLPHALHFEVTKAVSEWFFSTKGKWSQEENVDTILTFRRDK